MNCPEGPARQIDVSRQKLSPHCLEAIFDSQLPSPKLSPKMPPELSLPHKRGLFVLLQNYPMARVIARQVRDKNCLAAIFAPRHQSVSSGPLGGLSLVWFAGKTPEEHTYRTPKVPQSSGKPLGARTCLLIRLKKAVAVSDKKIQERSRRQGRFSSSHFPCREMPKPWQRD